MGYIEDPGCRSLADDFRSISLLDAGKKNIYLHFFFVFFFIVMYTKRVSNTCVYYIQRIS